MCIRDRLFCAKHGGEHAGSPLERANGPLALADGPLGIARKAAKWLLSRDPVLAVLVRAVPLLECAGTPERVLRRVYRGLIGLHIFRGWRDGLRTLARQERAP